jgi:transcriptional regulator of acetoin/glycerol metabolism
VLQEHEFERLGGTRPIPLNARLLFATHRNLKDMVEQGSMTGFRLSFAATKFGIKPVESIDTIRNVLNQWVREENRLDMFRSLGG